MPVKSRIPSESEMVANLRAMRSAASPEHVREGREWYPSCYRLCKQIAAESRIWKNGIDDRLTAQDVAALIASFSMNQGWKGNVTMVLRYCAGNPAGLTQVLDECERILDGEDPAEVMTGSKRPNFYRNIIGRHTYVTCDRWHLKAAGCEGKPALTPELCAMVTRATRKIAREYGEGAATTQAIIWCHIRGTGE